MVEGVLIKGMDYLFASQWHFACLPNSCCGLSTALAWLTALHWLNCRHMVMHTNSPAHRCIHCNVHQYFPQEFYSCQGGKTSEKVSDGTHTEC